MQWPLSQRNSFSVQTTEEVIRPSVLPPLTAAENIVLAIGELLSSPRLFGKREAVPAFNVRNKLPAAEEKPGGDPTECNALESAKIIIKLSML